MSKNRHRLFRLNLLIYHLFSKFFFSARCLSRPLEFSIAVAFHFVSGRVEGESARLNFFSIPIMTKFFTPKRLALSLALTGAVLPVALIGCGGGGGTSPLKTRTGVTPTPVTPQTLALTPATFTLQNGQRVTLTGTRTGTQLKGNLKVAAAPLARLQTGSQKQAFPFQIAVGNYGYTGTFTPPRGFNIVGNFGSLGSFTMSGQLQTTTQDGSYSLTTNGTTDTGILPATGTPTGTPTATGTPRPTATTAPSPGATATPVPTTPGGPVIRTADGTFNFTVANNAESNFVFTDIKGSGDERAGSSSRVTGGILLPRAQRPIAQLTLTAQPIGANQDARPESMTVNPLTRKIDITCYKQGNFAVGDRFQTGYNEPSEFDEGFVTVGRHFFPPVTTKPNSYQTWGSERNNTKRLPRGSITITALTPNSITVALKDVLCSGFSVTGNDAAQGIITVNGTFTVNNYSAF